MTSPVPSTASQIIKEALRQWGLEELYADVDKLIKEGLSEDAINVELQQTDAYKQRFRANQERINRGLAVLSPAEYLAVEAGYRQVMQSYGLPSGFWDSTDDYVQLISQDVSVDEVNERVKTARDAFLSADPQLKTAWRELYGLADGAGIAALLDPDRALPIVTRMAATAKAGAAATANGLTADRGRLESYVERGYSQEQLTQAFSEIGTTRSTEEAMARRFGTTFTQAEAEGARVEGLASARRKQEELYASEQALFDSRASADASSLNRRSTGRF